LLTAARSPLRRLADYYRDPEYYRQIARIGVPIAFQQFAFALLTMLGNIMVGQRGDVAMAAVGVASQIYFLLSLFLFGVASGSAMVTAQLWGKGDTRSIRRVLALCLWMSLAISAVFVAVSQTVPDWIVGIYTPDPAVIALGGDYLRILSGAFLFFAVTFSFGLVLRSIGTVRLPVTISICSLGLNILLSYGLIFGRLGLPEMGVLGAAWAAVVSRFLECLVLLILTYASRSPVAASVRELLSFDRGFFIRVMKPVLPVVLNEVFWSLGITAYNIIYGHIGTEALAAIGILSTVDNLALVLFMGTANATSVTAGNSIGAGDQDKAYRYAGRSLGLGLALAIQVGAILLLLRQPIVDLYKVSPEAAGYAFQLLTIHALFLWIRATNMTIIVGLLRGGGDTWFSFVLDGLIIWLLGVPMAWIGANSLHLPVPWVYLMVMSEEAAKFIFGLRRYFTRKWIHDLTHLSAAPAD
jgi:putative MATE family efflux protein